MTELLSFRYEARETERLLREKVVSLTTCNEELRAKAGMKAAVQKAEQAEVASEEHVRQLREKVVKLARQQDAAMRSAAVQREAIKSEAAELKQKLRVMEGVVSQLTSAEAQELRRQSVSLKPQVDALMRKA